MSLLVPTYNGSAFLRECLDSALAQTERDIEVLVVDDASTDATAAIAREYERRDPRVRVTVNARNLGLVGNWNEAVRLARGAWVKFLFQDDLLAPTCVERLLDATGGTGAGFAGCARGFAFEAGISAGERARYESNRALIAGLAGAAFLRPADVAAFAIRNVGINFVGEPTVTLIRRDVFNRVGLFDPALAQRCDTEFWVRVGIHEGVAMVAEELATFRVHPGSASSANYSRRLFADQRLDPLVILHHYLFDPAYEPLRQVEDMAPSRRAFWLAALDAKRDVSREFAPENGLRIEWRRVASHYPRLENVPLAYRLASLVARALR